MKTKVFKFKGLSPNQKRVLEDTSIGLGGFSLGAVAMTLMGSGESYSGGVEHIDGDEELSIPVDSDVAFSTVVTDNMSFDQAFASARKELGAGGFFNWHGKTYNTYYKEEWDSMTDVEKSDIANAISPHVIDKLDYNEDQILSILNEDIDKSLEDYEDIIISDDAVLDFSSPESDSDMISGDSWIDVSVEDDIASDDDEGLHDDSSSSDELDLMTNL